MKYRFGWQPLSSACWFATVVIMCGSLVAASEDPRASAPGSDFYGDPGVPDIAGLWLETATLPPGRNQQGPSDQRQITRWAPWPAPLKPTYQKILDDRRANDKAGRVIDDPGARCVQVGNPRAITGIAGYPNEVIQTPGEVSIWLWAMGVVTVWTDGRPHPKDFEPTQKGHSIGSWVGDTLFVDTVGIAASTPIENGQRTPHSAKLHMKWSVQRVAKDTLHVHVTLYDEDAFTEPMVTTDIWRRKSGPNWEVLDDGSCFENNRDLPDAKGVTGFQTF